MSISIKAPASKSVSHRAVIAAALAPGPSILTNVLDSEDLGCTIKCLQSLGAKIEGSSPGTLTVSGIDPRSAGQGELLSLDVGESGTTCRLITPVAALGERPCRIFGRGRMHQRPIQELTQALMDQGCELQFEDLPGCPPFVLTPHGLSGGQVNITLEQSSQYLSGLLLAAPSARSQLTINVTGQTVLSWPYVALTLQVMQAFGRPVQVQTRTDTGEWRDTDWTELVEIVPGRTRFIVSQGTYIPGPFQVEGDWSNASYFLAAGLLHPQGVTVSGLDPDSRQGDRQFLDIITSMGAAPQIRDREITTFPTDLTGLTTDMGSCPDLVPTVAVLAALAQSPTRIDNVAHLRLKESDRAQAMATELERIGTRVDLHADGLSIYPQPLPRGESIRFCTYGDHRVAMSLSLFEQAGIMVHLDQPACVAKSFPQFWDTWKAVQEGIQ
ncbi:MAG: 3-phosphoshikimate 1-carboxyvinyltransferase [Desulfovermiculus sp.]|nr:3-phosphoshikimate 1-carboxyvinyltransferase [Desulfovermiculus sp.]